MITSVKLSSDDYILIEKQHMDLDKFLNDLHDTCCNLDNQLDCKTCSTEKLASYRGRSPSFLYRLLETTGTHYDNEESIMLSRSHITEKDSYFLAYRESHGNIMNKLRTMANECAALDQQGMTAEGYRQLYKKISDLFQEHDRSIDSPFIESTHHT